MNMLTHFIVQMFYKYPFFPLYRTFRHTILYVTHYVHDCIGIYIYNFKIFLHKHDIVRGRTCAHARSIMRSYLFSNNLNCDIRAFHPAGYQRYQPLCLFNLAVHHGKLAFAVFNYGLHTRIYSRICGKENSSYKFVISFNCTL